MPKSTDIRIEAIEVAYEDIAFRAPLKFGGVAITCCTLLNVKSVVRTVGGKVAHGFGSMPLGNVWSFPSKKLGYDDTLNAMKALANRFARVTSDCKETGHPLDLAHVLEPIYLKAAEAVTRELKLPEPIPPLCTLVTASPFDAALHDAFGKAHGLNCYRTYGPDFVSHDLAHYLGAGFEGDRLDRYLSREPKQKMPMYHLVGALDPIEDADVTPPVSPPSKGGAPPVSPPSKGGDTGGDGLPQTLPEWINYNGLTHFKIKLNGEDLRWDVERVVYTDRVVAEVQKRRGVSRWYYSLDFNEKCASVGYLLDFLHQLKGKAPAGFDRVQYIEQPTARDLKADRANTMHEAAKLRPVVIDESLVDLDSLRLAQEMGYTGVALKACKGQSQSLLLAAAASKAELFLCVQDLTCPGASLIHSAGLAAHVPGVAAVECNSRQYCPAANRPWEARFPGIFKITDGAMQTGVLTGPGLGAVE